MKIKITLEVACGFLILGSGSILFLSILNIDGIYNDIVVAIFLAALAYPLLRKK